MSTLHLSCTFTSISIWKLRKTKSTFLGFFPPFFITGNKGLEEEKGNGWNMLTNDKKILKKHSKRAFLFSPKKSKQDKWEMLKESSETHMPCDNIVYHVFHRLYVCLCSCWIGKWQHPYLERTCHFQMLPLALHKRKQEKEQLNRGKKEKEKQNPKESPRKDCI